MFQGGVSSERESTNMYLIYNPPGKTQWTGFAAINIAYWMLGGHQAQRPVYTESFVPIKIDFLPPPRRQAASFPDGGGSR